MKRIFLVAVVLMLVLGLTGCSVPKEYVVGIQLIDPPGAEDCKYVDANLGISFTPILNTGVSFSIENLSDKTMRLLWDEAAFVDVDRTVSKVAHLGVKYIDAEKSMPPTVVPAGARVDEMVVPSKNISYSSGTQWTGGGWYTKPIIPPTQALSYDGKTIAVFLPIMIGEEKVEYEFTFRIMVREKDSSLW